MVSVVGHCARLRGCDNVKVRGHGVSFVGPCVRVRSWWSSCEGASVSVGRTCCITAAWTYTGPITRRGVQEGCKEFLIVSKRKYT